MRVMEGKKLVKSSGIGTKCRNEAVSSYDFLPFAQDVRHWCN